MPKISIIVPVYNVEKYLDRCVQSLLNQTLKDIEIILVDDGSPDNCPQLCEAYAKQDSRIMVVHKQNAGLGMACNSGLKVANGEYVAFCDSDDWVDAEMYETMYNSAHYDDIDILFTGLKRVDGSGKILGYLPHPKKQIILCQDECKSLAYDMIASSPFERFDRGIQVSAKTVLYRRRMLISNSLSFVSEREYPSEDLIFNISALTCAQKVMVMPMYFYNYFVNDNSITATIKPHHFEKMMKSAHILQKLLGETETVSQRIGRFVIGESRMYSKQIIQSSLSGKEKKRMIKNLSRNNDLINNVNNYPVNLMPIVHRIALKLLISNYYPMLYLLLKRY